MRSKGDKEEVMHMCKELRKEREAVGSKRDVTSHMHKVRFTCT